MRLGLILTARCNATCAHCSKSYGPRRTEELGRENVLRLMDEAASINDGEALEFAFTGGEPFLDFELLIAAVRHGAALGAEISCVTNAYWARTDEVTMSKLSVLQRSGLTALAVSVSRFHQKFVPLHRVRRALEVGAKVGLATELKGVVTQLDLGSGGALSAWKDSLDAEDIGIAPVLPYLREGETLPESEYYREPGLPPQKCPNEVVTVDFNGIARSCCSPGHEQQFLVLGDAGITPLAEIHRRFRQSAKQRILRKSGPAYFARAAIARGLAHRLRSAYAGPCDLCLHIRTDPELCRLAEEAAAALEADR